ncbi:MAG: hypothetical protein BWK77_06895 [Verrucomicrobia bacterium A1]|nr:MAG: hypothetical protein BWK77_06895 [Verrucomicrobia bacterium A1]
MTPSVDILSIAGYLARAAGLAGVPASDSNVNWSRWQLLVEENQLGPFLGSRLSPEWTLPPPVRAELATRHVRAGSAAAFQTVELTRVLRSLSGVAEVVVLKGAALIPILYHEAAERLMWDVDILFRTTEDRDRARAILEASGYRARKTIPGHHHLPALQNPVNGMVFELHTNLMTPPLAEGFMDEIWRTRRRTGLPFCTLDNPALLAHHCIHALNDPVESPLLRNLFEVGWLASRLSAAEQESFRKLVTKWKMAVLASRSLWLAAALFRTPTLFDAPRPSAYEFWCERRIEWCDCESFSARWHRHAAAAHIVRLLEGRSPHDPLVLPGVLLHSAWNALRSRVLPRLVRAAQPPRRSGARAVACGDLVILYDGHSRQTHLLNPLATKIWQLADGTLSSPELAQRLAGDGFDPAEAAAAIRQLLKMGILER